VPTINTASLRDELARLKGEYGTLTSAGKVADETRVLMSVVFVLLELRARAGTTCSRPS